VKAVVIEAPNDLQVKKIDDPSPRAGEVVVKVDACGICGTDIHVLRGEFEPDVAAADDRDACARPELGAQPLRVGECADVVEIGGLVGAFGARQRKAARTRARGDREL